MSLNFNANGRILNTGTWGVNLPSAFTVLSWVYPLTIVSGQIDALFASVAGNYQGSVFHINSASSGDLHGYIVRGGSWSYEQTTQSVGGYVKANTWNFVGYQDTAAGDSSSQKLFYGNLVTPAYEPVYGTRTNFNAQSWPTLAGLQKTIGGHAVNGIYYTRGYIGWTGFWGRALSLGEVIDQQFSPHVTTGCMGFWWLGKQNNSVQPDLSGYGRNGTTSNATLVWPNVPLVSKNPRKWYFIPDSGTAPTGVTKQQMHYSRLRK